MSARISRGTVRGRDLGGTVCVIRTRRAGRSEHGVVLVDGLVVEPIKKALGKRVEWVQLSTRAFWDCFAVRHQDPNMYTVLMISA